MARPDPGSVVLIAAMACATAALVVLLVPFAYAIGAAAITVTAAWPLHRRVLAAVRGHSWVAAGVSTTSIAVLALVPIAIVTLVFLREAGLLAGQIADAIERGDLSAWIGWVSDDGGDGTAGVSAWLARRLGTALPDDVDLGPIVAGPLRDATIGLLRQAAASLPAILQATLQALVGVGMYLLTTAVLFVEGPGLVQIAKEITPIAERYQQRLIELFVRISRNLVVGTFAIAVIQGLVSGIGYALFGVERIVFFGVMTAVCALVPFVGTTLVWVPLVAWTATEHGPARAIGLAVWSAVATTQIDNLLRPLFMRGSLELHPLLLLLAALGGLYYLGIPGALFAPFVAAAFVALYHICRDAFGGEGTRDDTG
jgi:predicted PurR-regulated permease PerM